MIQLNKVEIKNYDQIIETRNRVYRLALDLGLMVNVATRLAIGLSDALGQLLQELKSSIWFESGFSKFGGVYYLHLIISGPLSQAPSLGLHDKKQTFIFHWEAGEPSQFEIKIKIPNEQFVPTQDYIQEEKERLIQSSTTEMMYEIRRQNQALNQALQDLKTSSRVIQVEKMRALGTMTAGVAHELNNPMMGILNFIQYAIKHTDKDDRRYEPLIDAEREVKRCQDIITNLLTFSRMKAEGEENFKEEKLSTLVARIIQLHAYKLRNYNVEVVEKYPKNERPIPLKANKMQQVLLNFVTNAIDAMKNRSKRVLTLSINQTKEKTILDVKDTGEGMDEEMLDKIFEPFFTTKKTGEGTGLGLSVNQGIIEEHGGELACDSALGKGTTFHITLPTMRADVLSEGDEA